DRHDVAVVRERLAHPHEYDVRDLNRRDLAPRVHDLAEDLRDLEIAVEALTTRRAERAVERAACLRRDTERRAVRLGDKNGFDRLPGADVEKPLARAVLGALVTQHARVRDLRERLEPVAQLDGEIRHRGEIVDAALVDPAHDLPRAIRLLAER